MAAEKTPPANKEQPAKPAPDAKSAAGAGTPVPFADRSRNIMTIAVVGGLMLVEGAGILVAVKMFGGKPAESEAAEGEAEHAEAVDEHGQPLPEDSEIEVTDLVAFNTVNGRAYVYQIQVFAEIETKNKEKLKQFFENRQNTIKDVFSKVIRASDPKYLDEPGLETIRRQFKHELNQLLKDENLVREVLFPEFSKSRAD